MKKINHKKTTCPYNPDFVAKIKQGDEDIKTGRTKKISLDDLTEKSSYQSQKLNHS